jgi:D-amino peptidase
LHRSKPQKNPLKTSARCALPKLEERKREPYFNFGGRKFFMKKLLIVVDMEGVGGIGLNEFWSTIKGHPLYFFKRHLLVKEINAAISGAMKTGLKSDEIVVADWHLTRHNFHQNDLPRGVTLVRTGENKFLEGGVEKIFLIGFHAAAGTPVRYAHSFRYAIKTFMISDRPVGETTMWAYNAGSMGVPIALLAGDSFAVGEIKSLGLETVCVETKNEKSLPSPASIRQSIEAAAEQALSKKIFPLSSPSPFSVKFSFKSPKLTRNIPEKYFTRRDGEYLVIEGKTAHDVYDDFQNKVGEYIKRKNLGHKLLSIFEK